MPKIRLGKTRKDHKSGAHGRRLANRQARNDWCNDPKRDQGNFPYEVCNGKRNRTRYTGKGNETVKVTYTKQKGF